MCLFQLSDAPLSAESLIAGLTAPLLAASLLSGCGGDEKSSGGDSPSAETSSSAPAEEPSPDEDPSTSDAAGAGTPYCELLGTDFATLFAGIEGPKDVAAAIEVIKQIGAEAPDEVEQAWGKVEGALDEVKQALTQAAKLKKQAASGEVTPKQMKKQTAKLTKDMEALNTPGNAKAGEVVAKHASDYCGVTLG